MPIRKSNIGGIPHGGNAERPATPGIGQPFFNGDASRLELYTTTTGWQNIVQETPSVVNVSGIYVEAAGSGTITINGTNFVAGAIAYAIGTNGVQVQADSTSLVSAVEVSATFSGLDSNLEPYDIKIVNPSNLYGVLYDALQIDDTPIWITQSGTLGTYIEQSPMSVNLSVVDPGNSPITYSVSSGSLPSGVSINPNSGVISGIPTNIIATTTYSFSIDAFDGENHSYRNFSITISDRGPSWVTAQTLPSFEKNMPYSATILASDDDGIDTYSIVSGSLPSGISLSPSGLISGTSSGPAVPATVTIRATDIGGKYSDRQFTIPNKGPNWITAAGALGSQYLASVSYSYQLSATDDSGTTPTYSLLSGSLPSGISLSPSGLISGIATATGDYTFTVSATDDNGVSSDRTFSLIESPTLPPQMNITTPGTYTWTVTKAGTFDVQAWGAGGQAGTYAAGRGGYVSGRFTTSPGTYYILVGGQGSGVTGGFNGGGAGGSGYEGSGLGGGGSTDIRISANTASNRIIVAAGGASSNTGGYGSAPPQGDGGSGDYYAGTGFVGYGGQAGSGCANGTNGGQYGGSGAGYGSGGGGGGLLSGGGGGGTDGPGASGGLGFGGAGGQQRRGTGGGGSGYYGGGGGNSGSGGCCGGGGGGSSYIDTTKFSNVAFTGGAQSGNGRIAFTLV